MCASRRFRRPTWTIFLVQALPITVLVVVVATVLAATGEFDK